MLLNERQKHSAELFAKGENITQITNECNEMRQLKKENKVDPVGQNLLNSAGNGGEPS